MNAIQQCRKNRDQGIVDKALKDLIDAANNGSNLMEPSIAAAKAGVTTGEWSAVLRDVFGEFKAPTGISNIQPTNNDDYSACLLYTSPSPRDRQKSRMPSSA